MMYCEKCREKKGWPDSLFISHGKCEVCGLEADCFSRASSQLPRDPSEVRASTVNVGRTVFALPMPDKVDPAPFYKGDQVQYWGVAKMLEFAKQYHHAQPNPSSAAIAFALDRNLCGDPFHFLRLWDQGEFDKIRENYPEAPPAIYIGADPLYKG